MKVLMFGWEFPPHITGGLGTACYGLTRSLLSQGTEIIFVVPKTWGDEASDELQLIDAGKIEMNISQEMLAQYKKQFSSIKITSALTPYLTSESYQKQTRHFQYNIASQESAGQHFMFTGQYGHTLMEEVTRYALVGSTLGEKKNFDVIHAHDWPVYPAGILASKASGKPLVVHVHATEFDRSGEHINQQVYNIEREGMHAADQVITVSNLTRNTVINRYGVNPNKVITVHNAVDFTGKKGHYNKPTGMKEHIVTFLGRVTFQKGPDYFIEAAAKILRRDKKVRFVMAGSGDMLEKMVLRVAELGIATRFHFTGFLKGEEVNKMYALSDVYVMPSVSEPFGISPLEAMRSSVPAIISKQSGVAEVLQHAIKVDFWDTDALADAIYGLIHYKGLHNTFVEMGKKEVETLKWEHTALKVLDIYHHLKNN